MDLATVVGIVFGLILIVGSIVSSDPAALPVFINIPSAIVVFGGTAGATLASFTLEDFKTVGAVTKNAFFAPNRSAEKLIPQIVELATMARRGGILDLESKLDEIEDEFMRRGLQDAIDGADAQKLRETLETDLAYMEQRHTLGQDLYNYMNKYAPAFGMIGTLIGLVIMLGGLDDPSTIGPKMAVALITTFYGAVVSNLMCQPISAKLKLRSQNETLYRQIIIEGVIMIIHGEQPRKVGSNLQAFLSPKSRAAMSLES